jgi:hypothetical protein
MIRLLENSKTLSYSKTSKVDPDMTTTPLGVCHARKSTCAKRNAVAAASYLRAAHAYMLISMPTGTSTIFGVFQAILALHFNPDERRPIH